MDSMTVPARGKRAAPPSRPTINWLVVGLALCGLIAATATMTTTGFGMYTIFGNVPVATVMTILAEVVLFATSWVLGKDIARLASGDIAASMGGRGVLGNIIRYAFLVGTFGLVFFICWFFSFNFYFNQMFSGGEDQLEAEQQPHQAADPVLFQLRQLVDKAVDQDASGILTKPAVQAYLGWIDSVDRLAKDGAVASQIAAQQARADAEALGRQQETKTRIDQLQLKLDNLARERAPIEDGLKSQRRDNDAALADIAKLQGQLNDLKSQLNAAQATAAEEDAQGRDGRLPGRGKEWQKANQAILDVTHRADAIQQKQLDPAEKTQHGLGDTIAKTEAKLAENSRAAEALNQQIAEARGQLPQARTDAGGAPVPTALPLATARTRFAGDPSPESYKALVDACSPAAQVLRSIPDIAGKLAGGDCQSEAVNLQIRARPDLLATQQEFAKACSPDVVNPRIEKITADLDHALAAGSDQTRTERRNTLASALQETQTGIVIPCIAIAARAGVPTEQTEKLESDLRAFVQRHTLRQDSFSQTRNAVTGLFDGTANSAARLGATIALAQDMFLLLLSILRDLILRDGTARPAPRRVAIAAIDWRPHPDDPPPVAAAKAILRAAQDGPRGAMFLAPDFDQTLPADQRDNAAQMIRQLTRTGAIRRGMGGRLLLQPEAVEQIEQTVLDHTPVRAKPVDAGPTAAPSQVAEPVPPGAANPVPETVVPPADDAKPARATVVPEPKAEAERPPERGRRPFPAASDASRYVELPSTDRRAGSASRSPQAAPPESGKILERLRNRAEQERRGGDKAS
jgi:hypothetical protein